MFLPIRPRTPISRCAMGLFTLVNSFALPAYADLLQDSHASLEARTVYFNSDLRDGRTANPQGASMHDESAQGFILKLQSGYTEGVVGL